MLLHIFGSRSGTEPYPGRLHCAFAIEHNSRLYWFDAGEGCAQTAHLMGVDLMRLRKVVISHPHYDHTGGLAGLFWTVRKLDKFTLQNREIDLFLPDIRIWEGVSRLLSPSDGQFSAMFQVHARKYRDGPLFDDEGLRVTALHNRHINHEDGAPWRSFGFLIECEGKRVVYSGDTKSVDDFAPLMLREQAACCRPCVDILLMETGHHNPPAIAQELLERGLFPGKLAFIHHGRDILDRHAEQVQALDEIAPGRYVILDDGMTLEV